jgi:hypothetical protein
MYSEKIGFDSQGEQRLTSTQLLHTSWINRPLLVGQKPMRKKKRKKRLNLTKFIILNICAQVYKSKDYLWREYGVW